MRAARPGVLVVGAVAAGLAGCGGAAHAPTSEPDAHPSASVRVSTLDAGAVGVADVDGAPWLVLPEAGTVRTGKGGSVRVGRAPLRIVATPAGVWVSVIGDGTIVRIDPSTGEVDRRIRVRPAGSEPEGLAWDGDHLWVVDQAGDRVLETDGSGAVTAGYRTGAEPRLVATGPSGTWVAGYGSGSVTRIAHGRARTVDVPACSGLQGIAEAAGRVWVSCTLSGKAVALDAVSMRQVAEVPSLPDADRVLAHGDTVYVVGQSGPTVYVIDAATAALTATVPLDDQPPTRENVDAAVVGAELVVTHPDARRVYALPLP